MDSELLKNIQGETGHNRAIYCDRIKRRRLFCLCMNILLGWQKALGFLENLMCILAA